MKKMLRTLTAFFLIAIIVLLMLAVYLPYATYAAGTGKLDYLHSAFGELLCAFWDDCADYVATGEFGNRVNDFDV